MQAEASTFSLRGGSTGSDIFRNVSCRVHSSVLRSGGKERTRSSFFSGVCCKRGNIQKNFKSSKEQEDFLLVATGILGSHGCRKELWISFRLRLKTSVSGTKIDKIF